MAGECFKTAEDIYHVCHDHKLRWRVGPNRSTALPTPEELDAFMEMFKRVKGYRPVKPYFRSLEN